MGHAKAEFLPKIVVKIIKIYSSRAVKNLSYKFPGFQGKIVTIALRLKWDIERFSSLAALFPNEPALVIL